MSDPALHLSIIIPTLNESVALPLLLADLAPLLGTLAEVIVSDGSSTDDTIAIAAAAGARVVVAPRGRGAQLRAGADAARGSVLAFFHADIRLNTAAIAALAELLATDGVKDDAWAFRLKIDGAAPSYRLVEAGANLRSQLFGLPYGDQGLIVSRNRYAAAGGYAALPLMEDVALVRSLRPSGSVRLLSAHVRVSPRRWERDGVWRRSSRNLMLLGRYLTGTSPDTLAREYEHMSGH